MKSSATCLTFTALVIPLALAAHIRNRDRRVDKAPNKEISVRAEVFYEDHLRESRSGFAVGEPEDEEDDEDEEEQGKWEATTAAAVTGGYRFRVRETRRAMRQLEDMFRNLPAEPVSSDPALRRRLVRIAMELLSHVENAAGSVIQRSKKAKTSSGAGSSATDDDDKGNSRKSFLWSSQGSAAAGLVLRDSRVELEDVLRELKVARTFRQIGSGMIRLLEMTTSEEEEDEEEGVVKSDEDR